MSTDASLSLYGDFGCATPQILSTRSPFHAAYGRQTPNTPRFARRPSFMQATERMPRVQPRPQLSSVTNITCKSSSSARPFVRSWYDLGAMKRYSWSSSSRKKRDLPLLSYFDGFDMSWRVPSVTEDYRGPSSPFSSPSHRFHDETANLVQKPTWKGLDDSSTYDSLQTSFLEAAPTNETPV